MTNSFGKTASEMLDELVANKVEPRMYMVYGKYYFEIEKEHEGVKLNVKIAGAYDQFLPTIREAYDKWQRLLEGTLKQHLGQAQIEHKKEEEYKIPPERPTASESLKALHEAAQGQETEEAPGTDPDMQF